VVESGPALPLRAGPDLWAIYLLVIRLDDRHPVLGRAPQVPQQRGFNG
jgi:hypothetical protein